MNRFVFTILLYQILSIMNCNAQNVMLFNSKQGLSNSTIQGIYEDSRHSIWIMTQNGLNRYDGMKMNVYRHDEGDKMSLLHDDATYVCEYDKNHILVGTVSGLQMYDYATDRFTHIPLVDDKGDTTKTRIVCVKPIKDNGEERVLVSFAGYGNGVMLTREDGSMYCKWIDDYKVNDVDYYATDYFHDTKDRLWFMHCGQNIYLRQGKALKLVPGVKNAIKLVESAGGHIFAVTYSDGLYQYDEKSERFELVVTGDKFGGTVCTISPWRDSRLFVCTDGGGLRIYDEKTKVVTQSNISINDFDLLTSNVKDAICDTYGNVWVGVYWMGVMMKPQNQTAFEYVGRNSITKNTIGKKSVFTIAKADDSHIWLSSDNDGLYLLSADGLSSVHYGKENTPGMPSSFTAVYQTEDQLLSGTFMDGLWRMQNGRFSFITKDINHIFDIKPADNGNVWIATLGEGFYYYNPRTQEYVQYSPKWGNNGIGDKILGNPYIFTILQDGDKVFAGSADGMNICHYDGNGKITQKSERVLSGYCVKHIVLSDDKKSVWAATDNGLICVNVKTLETKRYSTADGLPNNSVKALHFEDNKLWISTDNGISALDVTTNTFTNFFADDGLQDNEFNRAVVLSLNGNLYFGGISGLSYFNAKTIEKRQHETVQLRLKLVDVQIGGKTIHKGDLSRSYEVLQDVLDDCSVINLAYSDNHFILELCVEGLSNQHINYEYSINGGEWTDQGGMANRIVFNNLAPGTYKIKVRALALGAVSEEREITVKVHAPWYASWWAKLFYLLLAALIGYLIYLYIHRQVRARRVLARHRQQQEINEARIQFFMNISHEIRTPMTLILAPLERLLGADKNAERQRSYTLMKQNADRILRLINQMMDVRKIEQGKFQLDYHKIELVSLLQNTFDVFQSKANSHSISYEFKHDGIVTLPAYVDPENIDKIVMNLLSNAFKFTPDGGEITLSLVANTSDEDPKLSTFTLAVTDTGCGVSDADKKKIFDRFYSASRKNGYIGTGIGLNLSSMLVKLHKGTIDVLDNPEGKGTQFVITAPLTPEDTADMPVEVATEIIPEVKPDVELPVNVDKDTEGLLVLVEDDASIREYVCSELSRDFSVHEFIDGQKAWDYIVANPDKVDLVISDIMMPVMDGLTLCQKLKANFNTNHIPILLMTALGSDADRIVGITNGADAYISKPFNIDVLESTALGLMKNRQLLQGRFKGEQIQKEETEQLEVESPDEQFMKRVMKVINENIDNDELSVEIIADMVGVSRVHFYRKMKDLTGQGPREFVKYVRLKEAARLLSTKKMDITGVSIACGFKTISTFSASFKQLYGMTPTEWMRQHTS